MVKPLEFALILGVLAVAVFALTRKNQPAQGETIIIPNPTPPTTFGLPEGAVTGGGASAGEVKENVITSNLVTQEALQNIFNNRTGAQGLDIFEDENFKINIPRKFKPIGSAKVINPVTGKLVNPKFVGREIPTFQIDTLNKKTGEVKTRFGSEGLAKRLQENFAKSSLNKVI